MEESQNPFATVVLAHLDTQETRRDLGQRKERKFGLVKGLRRRGWTELQVRQLFKLIDWMMDLPKPLAQEFWTEVKQYEEKELMPFITTPERYGRIDAFVESVETILEARFPAACNELIAEIRPITDHDQLKEIVRAAATVSSPDELRKLWTTAVSR